MRFYNTLSRQEEELTPLRSGQVSLYTCGPTVYHFAHIGNLRTFVFYDVLERALAREGFQVKRVMNITDVGHLTSDADEGEDKMDKAVAREQKSVEEIISFYTEAFIADAKKLNIRIPADLPRASHYIPQQIELIQALSDKGFAYDTPEAVYFDTSKLPDYGKLSGQSLEDKEVGAREEVITETSKKHPADFALWFKRVGRFANHVQHWPSPWGEGFPGWHLECSALIKTFLGQPIDIHTGGVDHIGTHHTNEIAQSEAAYGAPLASLWLHGEHLLVDNKKMAKSEGNFYILADIENRGINPLAFRYLILGAHYRTKLNFTWDSLKAAATAQQGLQRTYWQALEHEHEGGQNGQAQALREKFSESLANDLNTPQALALLHAALSSPLPPAAQAALAREFNEILQVITTDPMPPVPKEIMEMAARREEARANKQFVQADDLRGKINDLGYTVDDTPQGPVVYPR